MSIHTAILGPSLFGKSNAAKHLAASYWRNRRIRSLVLDPTTEPGEPHGWPSCCLVIQGEGEGPRARFYDAVFKRYEGCAVFFDEGGEVERDKDMNPYFTRIRHRYHFFHYIGHNWTDMLPKQRNQLGTLLLFWQPADASETIAREWSDPRLLDAVRLPQYEFLYCRKFALRPAHDITRASFPPFAAALPA